MTDDFVPRRRLQERLDFIARRPLTLVSAPAGYGKTTAVSAWLEESRLHKAWLSLDEGDNDLGVFLTYLLAAIRGKIPAFGIELGEILESGQLLSSQVFVKYFFAELDALDPGLVLVLDDCYVISNTEVLAVIRELMRHPHPALHLVLVSRHDPQLPLSQWQARNQMISLRSGDLRFSLEETTAFLNAAAARPLDDQTISILHRNTEGWAAGLRLAILSLAHAGDIESYFRELSANNQHIIEFLTGQVFAGLPADQRSFLMRTSILNRLSGSLCEALGSSSGSVIDGQAMLNQLNRENLFMVPLDSEHEWFRYHHLFGEFLRSRLAQEYSREEVACLHGKASRWFAKAGFDEEAIRHAMLAGEMDEAVNLMAANRHDLLNQERFGRLASLYNLFPEQVVNQSPDLLLIKAWLAHSVRLNISELDPLTDEIDSLISRLDLDPERARQLLAENSIFRGVVRYFGLDPAGSLACCEHALEVLPKRYYTLRSFARVYAAVSLQMRGDTNGAYEMAELGQEEDLALPGVPRVRNVGAGGYVHWMVAHLAGMEQLGEHVLALTTSTDQRISIAWSHYFLACAHYHWNDLARARSHAQKAFDSRLTNRAFFALYAGFILALVHQATGDQEELEETMALINAYALELQSGPLIATVQAFRVELDIRQGRVEQSAQWAERALPNMRPTALPFFYAPQFTALKALLTANHPARAELSAQVLAGLRAHVETIHNTRFLIEVLALEAMFHDSQGDEKAAFASLQRSLSLAEPSGFIRLYVDLGSQMNRLLSRLSRRGSPNSYILRILAAFATPSPQQHEALVEPLTERELQILELLAQRLSNKEIAQQLFISVLTVKRHTINIYQKLGVQSRRDAVQAAQSLGLIR